MTLAAPALSPAQMEVRSRVGSLSPRYMITTFGCQMNEHDSEQMAGLLEAMGFLGTDRLEDADLVILNTCSVREHADERLFGRLGQLKHWRKERPDRILAVCGCMMKQSIHLERLRARHPFVDLVFGPADLERFPDLLNRVMRERAPVVDVSDDPSVPEGLPVRRAYRYRALVTIMYGCDNFCSYCIVPYTRGRERSRSMDAVLAELRDLAAEGYPEVLLLGQNVNSYGRDLGHADFPSLLDAAAGIPGLRRIRFMTSHPKDASDDLFRVMARHPSICPHLHLPLQSGSSRVLQSMNRGYTREQYEAIVRLARDRIPGLAIGTDLIVGYPGETEADFLETLGVMETVRFDSAFTFLYSPRAGTPAAVRDDPVDPDVMADRFNRLVTLQQAHAMASGKAEIGRVRELLVEGRSRSRADTGSGRTIHNRLVHFPLPGAWRGLSDEALQGRFVPVRILESHGFYLEGDIPAGEGPDA